MKKNTAFKLLSFIGIIILLPLFIISCSKEAAKPDGKIIDTTGNEPVQVAQRIKSSMVSKHIIGGYSYPLEVYLPKSYSKDKKLPIVYLLDGSYLLDKTINSSQSLNKEVIIVGIGDFLANGEINGRRQLDFNPTRGPGPKDFYKFLTEEVIPFIDANYANDQESRTLLGYNIAGVFTTYTMFMEEPAISFFQNFLAIDLGHMFVTWEMMTQDNFPQDKEPKNLFISVSKDNDLALPGFIKGFYTELNAKNYGWLKLAFSENLNLSSTEAIEPSMTEAFRFIFDIE